MDGKSTGRDSDKFMLRLPDGMRERIKSAAERNGRSMNAEIVSTLEQAYPPMTMDVELLADYLSVLSNGTETEGKDAFLEDLNEKMALTERPWTAVSDGFGVVTFFPYKTEEAPNLARLPKRNVRLEDDE